MSKISLTYIAIIRQESKIIERCLESLLPITDYFVISDTGSSDNTVEVVESFLKKHKKKGKVFQDTWVNFGHNRSLSVTNAQQWLKEENIDLSTNYLITIDADMLLEISSTFTKDSLKNSLVWMIRQKNPSIVYYNTRLFRADLVTKCVSVTHEYWQCENVDGKGEQPYKLETISIDDRNDGGCKSDKFERDIRLLTQGLIDEPDNVRYLFYLAQSYFDTGDYENAIKYYTKRVDAGGWIEEMMIACLRLGEIYMRLKQPDKAIMAWSNGYQVNPYRSETIVRMANYFRNIGKNELSLLYLRQMARMDYPKDQVLFIEHKVYEYGLFEECSISCCYVGNKDCGLHACNYLLLKKDGDQALKQMCLQNIYFYLKPFNWSNYQKLELNDINKDIWKSSSSSLLLNGKHVNGVIRAVNYSMNQQFQYTIRDPQSIVRTKNYWVNFKKDDKGVLTLKSCNEIECNVPTIRSSHISGLEDLKIVNCGKRIFGLATSFEHSKHNHPSIVITHLEQDKSGKMIITKVVPTHYEEDKTQKNWAPFWYNNRFCAIYSHHPLIILDLNADTGNSTYLVNKYTEYDLSDMRGSASPIQMKNGDWLVLVHEVVQKDTRKYYHRILKYSPTWDLLEISNPFYFQKLFVEFSLSMYLEKENLFIPFSTEDNTTEIVTIPLEKIAWVPKDIRSWIRKNI